MFNAHLSRMDPEFAQAFAAFPPPSDAEPDLATMRENAKLMGSQDISVGASEPIQSGYQLEVYNVSVRDGEITVRCMIPSATQPGKTSPLLVWYHGGGFAAGAAEMDDPYLKVWCTQLQIVIVNVDYRLTPEHPFPIPWTDCIDATIWAVENAATISASPENGLIMGGSSAGANLAANVAQVARHDPRFARTPVTGQFLQIPTVLHPADNYAGYASELYSREQNKDAMILSQTTMVTFAEWAKAPTGIALDSEPCWSVLLRPNRAGQAPVYFQVCGLDPLRDEGILYERLLREAGVSTRIDLYPGVPHAFFYVLPHLQAAKKLLRESLDGMQWLLARKQ